MAERRVAGTLRSRWLVHTARSGNQQKDGQPMEVLAIGVATVAALIWILAVALATVSDARQKPPSLEKKTPAVAKPRSAA